MHPIGVHFLFDLKVGDEATSGVGGQAVTFLGDGNGQVGVIHKMLFGFVFFGIGNAEEISFRDISFCQCQAAAYVGAGGDDGNSCF